MSNVAKFIEIRQHIESLAEHIAVSAERKTIPESSQKLEEATKLLTKLTAMADNDVQEVVIERLTRQLAGLGTKVEALIAKKRVVKKQLVV
jgi:predicted nucleic acid-binding protein